MKTTLIRAGGADLPDSGTVDGHFEGVERTIALCVLLEEKSSTVWRSLDRGDWSSKRNQLSGIGAVFVSNEHVLADHERDAPVWRNIGRIVLHTPETARLASRQRYCPKRVSNIGAAASLGYEFGTISLDSRNRRVNEPGFDLYSGSTLNGYLANLLAQGRTFAEVDSYTIGRQSTALD